MYSKPANEWRFRVSLWHILVGFYIVLSAVLLPYVMPSFH